MAKQLQLPIHEMNIRVRSTFWNNKKKKNVKEPTLRSYNVWYTLFSMCVTTPISPLFSKVHLRWDLNRIRREYFSSFTFCYVKSQSELWIKAQYDMCNLIVRFKMCLQLAVYVEVILQCMCVSTVRTYTYKV